MRVVEHKSTYSAQSRSNKSQLQDQQEDLDPIIIKKLPAHEKMAEEIRKNQVDSEALELGSHPFERKQYFSQIFSISPKFVTNRGLVKIKGRNIDYVQLLQRN
jgi:hypothetical protein